MTSEDLRFQKTRQKNKKNVKTLHEKATICLTF